MEEGRCPRLQEFVWLKTGEGAREGRCRKCYVSG